MAANSQPASATPVVTEHGCAFQSRNLRIGGKRTSIRLEKAMWEALDEIAMREKQSVAKLCDAVAACKTGSNLTAAVRLFIITYFRIAARAADEAVPHLTIVDSATGTLHSPALPPTGSSPLMRSALTVLG